MTSDAYKQHYGKICRDIVRKRSREMPFLQMEKYFGVTRNTLKSIDDGKCVSMRTIRRILLKEGVEMIESI